MEKQDIDRLLMEKKQYRDMRDEILKEVTESGRLATRSSMGTVFLGIVMVMLGVHPYAAIAALTPLMLVAMGIALGRAMGTINKLYDSFLCSGKLPEAVTPAQIRALAKADKAYLYMAVGLSLAGAVVGLFALTIFAGDLKP